MKDLLSSLKQHPELATELTMKEMVELYNMFTQGRKVKRFSSKDKALHAILDLDIDLDEPEQPAEVVEEVKPAKRTALYCRIVENGEELHTVKYVESKISDFPKGSTVYCNKELTPVQQNWLAGRDLNIVVEA